MFTARFDDLADGESFQLVDPIRELRATDLSDVAAVVDAASLAAREGNWVAGYVAYDASPAFDPTLVVRQRGGRDSLDLPLAWFGVFADRSTIERPPVADPVPAYSISRWTPLVDRDEFHRAFGAVKAGLDRGEAGHVVLAFPMRAAVSGDAGKLYDDLIESEEAGCGTFLHHDGISVLSISPEKFFAISDGTIVTRPMKGTMHRGRWSAEDEIRRRELASSEEDRRENLSVVDEVRDAMALVGEAGTVHVDDLFSVEPHRATWQMSSRLSARLRPGTSLGDVFRALFPSASATGVPKAPSMAIAAAHERLHRGLHGGAIGLVPPGDGIDGARFTVAIRTAVVHESEGVADYGVGGAVGPASDADTEYDEALLEARLLAVRTKTPGLYESIRWNEGWLWRDEHSSRLQKSAAYFGCALPGDIEDVLAEIEPSLTEPATVQIGVHRDRFEVAIDAAPPRIALGPGPDSQAVHLVIDLDPVDRADPHLYHKTLQRTAYEQRARRHPEVGDVVLTNEVGNVTESTSANVVFRIDDRWVTPPITDGLLPGIMRDVLIREGMVEERSVSVADAYRADAVALINSVRGWRPAVLDRPE